MKNEITYATFSDVPHIIRLYSKTLEPICNWNYHPNILRFRTKNEWVIVCKRNKRVLGALVMDFHIRAEIESLAVHKRFQRQGIGSSLIQKACEKIKELEWDEVQVGSYKSFNATQFYTKMGFKITDEGWDGRQEYRDFKKKLD